jgi:hypothetical protein
MDKAQLKLHAKNFGQAAVSNGKMIGFTTIGIIASNELLDLRKYADKLNIQADNFIVKHQGGAKALGVIFVLYKWGKKMGDFLKFILLGVGIQGAIQEARTLSGDKLNQIGSPEMDNMLKEAAEKIKNMSGAPNPTNEFPTMVAGMGNMVDRQLEIRPDIRLMTDAMTTVAGMGAGAYSDSPFKMVD